MKTWQCVVCGFIYDETPVMEHDWSRHALGCSSGLALTAACQIRFDMVEI
jgi:hypothetical protein